MSEHNFQLPVDGKQPNIEWERAFIRSGFFVQKSGNGFVFKQENELNQRFLRHIIVEVEPGQARDIKSGFFSPALPTVNEGAWLGAVEKLQKIRGGSEGGYSDMQRIELGIMETYMAGIVRWVNAAGFKTSFSCDGHGDKEPELHLSNSRYAPLLDFCLRSLSDRKWRFENNRRLRLTDRPRYRDGAARSYDRTWLLDVAEALHQHQEPIRELVKAAEAFSASLGS